METHTPQAKRTLYALRNQEHAVILDPVQGSWELYDLAADPRQENDIFDASDPTSLRWRQQLLQTLGRQGSHATTPVSYDEETAEMLRSLGYAE